MKILTFWLPAALLIGAIVNSYHVIPYFYEEFGWVENFTVIFLLGTIGVLLKYSIGNFKSMEPMDKALTVIMILGAIYFAGEELSWGQHIVGFKTPDSYKALNHQKEANLHNLGGIWGDLFDKIPRAVLTIGIFFGGILFPFIKEKLPSLIRRYVPSKETFFVSVLAVFLTVPEKIYQIATHTHHERVKVRGMDAKAHIARWDGGEMKELYIALFILLFAIGFIRYVKARRIERSLIA